VPGDAWLSSRRIEIEIESTLKAALNFHRASAIIWRILIRMIVAGPSLK
jgi:hypothetical protein